MPGALLPTATPGLRVNALGFVSSARRWPRFRHNRLFSGRQLRRIMRPAVRHGDVL